MYDFDGIIVSEPGKPVSGKAKFEEAIKGFVGVEVLSAEPAGRLGFWQPHGYIFCRERKSSATSTLNTSTLRTQHYMEKLAIEASIPKIFVNFLTIPEGSVSVVHLHHDSESFRSMRLFDSGSRWHLYVHCSRVLAA